MQSVKGKDDSSMHFFASPSLFKRVKATCKHLNTLIFISLAALKKYNTILEAILLSKLVMKYCMMWNSLI